MTNMFSTASSRHPQLLHNITNWDKERTTRITRTGRLTDSNFINRLLFKDIN